MSKEEFLKEFMNKVWNGQRKDLLKKYVADSYTIHLDTGDHWEGKTLDHAEFRKRLDFSFDSFSDMHFDIQSSIEEEGHVAITWILTGTNNGMIGGFPPTHKKIKTRGMTIYYFKNNLICGHAQVFDRTMVMKQLGFV